MGDPLCDQARGSLDVLRRRLTARRRDQDEARSRHRSACAEMFRGRGDERAVQRAEAALAVVHRDLDRTRAAISHWDSALASRRPG
jgi:hypothetical protein